MKKIICMISLISVMLVSSGCTKQVVFLDRNLNQTKQDFQKFISTTPYTYKHKDDINNIYNIKIGEYNYQYLLQSKPMISYEYGFSCKFKALGKDTLMDCRTYPDQSGIMDIRRYLKEMKWDNIQYVSYKKYKEMKKNKKEAM